NASEALALMTAAADLEESMDKHAVTPGAILPAREMVGQLQLEQKHPKEALAAFQSVLKVAPKRFNALYGAATAADASGDRNTARQYYREVVEASAANERPEVEIARKKTTASAPGVSTVSSKK